LCSGSTWGFTGVEMVFTVKLKSSNSRSCVVVEVARTVPRMLAPRKKLWSSPKEVIDAAIDLLALTDADTCFDIGCGDGRFLMRSAELTAVRHLVGIEIDEERAGILRERISSSLSLKERCEVICGNALEQDFSRATAFFMYLIPHGLKTVYKHIIRKITGKRIKIVTYMSPLPEVEPVRVVKVETSGHSESEWPLYYYEILNSENEDTELKEDENEGEEAVGSSSSTDS
jgi:predicted RNA methylase